jgi:hypothetical protein
MTWEIMVFNRKVSTALRSRARLSQRLLISPWKIKKSSAFPTRSLWMKAARRHRPDASFGHHAARPRRKMPGQRRPPGPDL